MIASSQLVALLRDTFLVPRFVVPVLELAKNKPICEKVVVWRTKSQPGVGATAGVGTAGWGALAVVLVPVRGTTRLQ